MAVAGYVSRITDDKVREAVMAVMDSSIPQPYKIKIYSVETTVKAVALSSLQQHIRSRTGRAFSDLAALSQLLESWGLEKHTAHRGLQTFTVFSKRVSLRVVGGLDHQQTG